ncbi:MAG TPA: biopolymer transporter ExbD [Tepidisphaeraceae bacterium]|jgi:biopolymer transport protein ExbD|nr:biopolymer transporter ExbD [Tepidisphaeraceae bacterium]
MRIRDAATEGEEPYNLVPLTDMVFNLLIFFLCATTFVQIEKDLRVELPKTTSSFTPLSAAPKELIINITEDGKTIITGKEYSDKDLAAYVESAVKRQADQTVIIRADERSMMKYFAHVAQVCRNAKVKEAKLVYLDEKGS